MRIEASNAPVPVLPSPGPSTRSPADAVTAAPVPGAPGQEDLVGRLMAHLVRDADADLAQRCSRIRGRCRDAARARMRVLEQVRRQARARARGRGWERFKRFLGAVAAVLGAAAAVVASPFTGGGSVAGYTAAALGLASACAGGAAAGGAFARGRQDARAVLAGLGADRASGDVDASLASMETAARESAAIVEHVASLEQRVASIVDREGAAARVALGRRSC